MTQDHTCSRPPAGNGRRGAGSRPQPGGRGGLGGRPRFRRGFAGPPAVVPLRSRDGLRRRRREKRKHRAVFRLDTASASVQGSRRGAPAAWKRNGGAGGVGGAGTQRLKA